MGEKERILDHLENDYTEPIRDPVWKHIYVSRELLRIIELPAFQKLGRIKQLGPASLVYPGATHTRLSHSLGVFHIARRMIGSLVRRNPWPGGVDITREGVKAFLCAALLHDVGHYPFAHSLKDLQVEAHEVLAARQILGEFAGVIREALGIEPEAVASIIDRKSAYPGAENVSFYRKILSGVLDPDKLDYLNRDAYFCGVPYGIQDVDFILEEVSPHPGTGVAISRKGITALENVLFSKYLMYKTVYWHKTVRIATAMIKKAICLGLSADSIRREELYGLDDEEFFSGFAGKKFAGSRLIGEVRRRELFKQVLRIPFRQDRKEHLRLESLGERLGLEQDISRRVGTILGRTVPTDRIVIDVPERISFEIDLPVIEDGGEASGSLVGPGLFGELARDDMPGSLRCISLNASRDADLLSALARMDLSGELAPR